MPKMHQTSFLAPDSAGEAYDAPIDSLLVVWSEEYHLLFSFNLASLYRRLRRLDG